MQISFVPCSHHEICLIPSRYGEVVNVFPKPYARCVFVEFKRKEGAGKAMAALQVTQLQLFYLFFLPYPSLYSGCCPLPLLPSTALIIHLIFFLISCSMQVQISYNVPMKTCMYAHTLVRTNARRHKHLNAQSYSSCFRCY